MIRAIERVNGRGKAVAASGCVCAQNPDQAGARVRTRDRDAPEHAEQSRCQCEPVDWAVEGKIVLRAYVRLLHISPEPILPYSNDTIINIIIVSFDYLRLWLGRMIIDFSES